MSATERKPKVEPPEWFHLDRFVDKLEERVLSGGGAAALDERGFAPVDIDLHEQVLAAVDPEALAKLDELHDLDVYERYGGEFGKLYSISRPCGGAWPADLREFLKPWTELSQVLGFQWDNPLSGSWPLGYYHCRLDGLSIDLLLMIYHPQRIRVLAGLQRDAGSEVYRELFSELLRGEGEFALHSSPCSISTSDRLPSGEVYDILFERFSELRDFPWAGLRGVVGMDWVEHDLFELAAGGLENVTISSTYDEAKRRDVFDDYFYEAVGRLA